MAGANFFRVGGSSCVGIHQSVVRVGSDPLVGGLVGEDAGGRGELGQVVGEWNDVELAMGGDVVEQGEGLIIPRGRRQAGTGRERNRTMQKLDHTRTGAAQDGESHGVAALSRRQRALDKNIRGVRRLEADSDAPFRIHATVGLAERVSGRIPVEGRIAVQQGLRLRIGRSVRWRWVGRRRRLLLRWNRVGRWRRRRRWRRKGRQRQGRRRRRRLVGVHGSRWIGV